MQSADETELVDSTGRPFLVWFESATAETDGANLESGAGGLDGMILPDGVLASGEESSSD
jgi:hypothetical protein